MTRGRNASTEPSEAVPEDNAIAADALPTQDTIEMISIDRRWLVKQLPPLMESQLNAIEDLLRDVVDLEIQGDQLEEKLRAAAEAAMDSVRKICTQSNGVHLSLHGSLVSGLITDHSDINISLSVDGEERKYFVNEVFPVMEKASAWCEVRLRESPTGLARIEGVFQGKKVAIDWQNEEGVRRSKLLAMYNRLHDDVPSMRRIVRKWAEKCDLVTRDNLSSLQAVPPLQLDLMLIHSLQQSKRLPCIHEIRKNSGRDALDEDLDDITVDPKPWNLAEVFLEFLHFYSKGGSKEFFIQITCTVRAMKRGSKFNDKHMHVMDPIRDIPVASTQKIFLCYFLNCFLASYVYFRVPRVRRERKIESSALVNVELFQREYFMGKLKPREKKQFDKEGKPVLESTVRDLSIEMESYDLEKVTAEIESLSKDDYVYSFDSDKLTDEFKYDLHCMECETVDHLTADCPKLAVPPLLELSRAHWKPYHTRELDRVICRVFDSVKITPARQRALQEVLRRLRAAISMKIGAVAFRLDAYGSAENGFGSNTSDFDVCFRYGEEHETEARSEAWMMQSIAAIEWVLRYEWRVFGRVLAIPAAKIPIVQFATRVNGVDIEGDISYYNDLALHNTRLLKTYCSWTKDELLSKLGILIKRWAKQCEIGDAAKGSLSSYTYIILLIHFLQQLQPHPLLPVLHEMGEKKEIMVDGWDVYFFDGKPHLDWSKCTLSVGELFLQFLDFYAKFDWQNQVVQISRSSNLTKIERGWRNLMCIEDPFDRSRNLSSGIKPQMFSFIRKAFVISREVFFTLNERELMQKWGGSEDHGMSDKHIDVYGAALLAKCSASIGNAPRERTCRECGQWGHFVVNCPMRAAARGGWINR